MLKIDHKKAQAATELAVFGAILIFLIGTIVRSAAGNSYTQDQNFKAMRQAMLLSWTASPTGVFAQGLGLSAPAHTSRDSASVIIVEDRLSPDISKFGDLERNPYIATGQGTFTYELQYPMDPTEVSSNLPIQDVYINGQQFPFTNAAYFPSVPLIWSANTTCGGPTTNACELQKCQRNQREWVSNPAITASQFLGIAPVTVTTISSQCNPGFTYIPGLPTDLPNGESPTQCQYNANDLANATVIFNKLYELGGYISAPGGGTSATVVAAVFYSPTEPVSPTSQFWSWFQVHFPNDPQDLQTELDEINAVLLRDANHHYKLFYTRVANNGFGTGVFSPTPPAPCATPPCQNNALNSSTVLPDWQGTLYTNSNGDMEYDLLRLGNYNKCSGLLTTDPPAVEAVLPPSQLSTGSTCTVTAPTPNMRSYMAWQWAASAGTTAAAIGLDPTDYVYPSYDIDGRLKEVTIYGMSQDANGDAVVSYEDNQGGDIDTTWDATSCGPKPGIQPNAQVFTFTEDGTYLSIQEGKLLNTETNQVVRSVNKRDTIDLVQRTVQLSNDTGRFCDAYPHPIEQCSGNYGVACAVPNNVEVCVDARTSGCTNPPGDQCSCFTPNNIAKTCFDRENKLLYVRSRLQDLRGHFWKTGTSGQLNVQ